MNLQGWIGLGLIILGLFVIGWLLINAANATRDTEVHPLWWIYGKRK